MIFFAI